MAKNKPITIPGPICNVRGCNELAIGEFRETEDSSSSLITDTLAISETRFCGAHEENVSRDLNGYAVYYPENI
jgi:hypothetical protein